MRTPLNQDQAIALGVEIGIARKHAATFLQRLREAGNPVFDDPATDATALAPAAWWRGHTQGAEVIAGLATALLDGMPIAVEPAHATWTALRARIIAHRETLVARDERITRLETLLREVKVEVDEDMVVRIKNAVEGGAQWREPTFDLVGHLRRQRKFSIKTFGPGLKTEGILDHIRKELSEIAAKPADVLEWIDVVLLAFDGAWRTGTSPGAIAWWIDAKQTENERRKWPDWRTVPPGKAIEHIPDSEQPDEGGGDNAGK